MFDTHAHLQDARICDLDSLIERARISGVRRVLCCGISEKDWPRVAELATAHSDFIQPAYGLHPWYLAGRSNEWEKRLVERIQADATAAVGEIGLCGERKADADEMEEIFLTQLRLARSQNRPASLHARQAWGRLAHFLKQEGPFPAGVVLHSYSGPPDLMKELIDAGAYFSFSGSITWERNLRGRRAVVAVPLDRLLVETDAPDIPAAGLPPPMDGSRPLSEPAHLPRIIRAIADILQRKEDEVRRVTYENAIRVFGEPAYG